jgi:putative aldouronate transport system substrate-binding protein
MKKLLSLILALVMVLSLTGAAMADANYAEGTVLRMAVGYNSTKTGIVFDAEVAGEGVTLADGNTYLTGSLKPTWVELEKILGVKFESKYQGNGAEKEFAYWKDQLAEVDMVSGTAVTLSENGEAGLLVNLADYMDYLPNFKAYLDANPIVRLSITGNTETGAIYFSPYFDGVNDIERMPLMRVDWVEKLLDGEGPFTAEACTDTEDFVYAPIMPQSSYLEVDVVKADGSAVETIKKDYDAAGGNIINLMNEKGYMNGVDAVNMLRDYIDKAYNGYYGTKRSDLFVGQNAAWDADELVALLRCVISNPQTLNGTDYVEGIFSREENNNQRRVDLMRLAGHLFGVRGLESRKDYLYVGADGAMHDARQDGEAYVAMTQMNWMVQEGLISQSFVNGDEISSSNYLENDAGFMSYDYNQTQTAMNKTKLQNDAGEKYMAVMPPIAPWYDTGDVHEPNYMRFTESWRSVKTDGWAISKAGVEGDDNKLYACLALIDYAYSPAGQILMSYGPDAFIKTKEDGSYETFLFNGKEMPVIADATYAELWEKASGNYTNYARQYLGSTLSFVKSQAFEYQCTHELGKIGAGYISTAIGLGTIKHPELALTENPWYTSVPTVLPTTTEESGNLSSYSELNASFSPSKGGDNLFVNIIARGLVAAMDTEYPAEAAEKVTNNMFGDKYLNIINAEWTRLKDYYSKIQ